MKKNKKIIQFAILLAVVVVGALTISDSLNGRSYNPPAAGDKAPDFTVEGLDGNTYRLSDFAGKTVVLNFWGSFCEPCVREMPLLQDLYEKHRDNNVVVLGSNLDEKLLTVQSFVERTGVTFPILLDHTDIQKKYGVIYYPTTFVIDPSGRVKYKKIGEITDARELEQYF